MAVPKKKTSKSRRNMRRSHHALGKVNLVIDKETGEYRLPHRMSEGFYGGRKVLTDKPVPAEEDEDEIS